MTADDEVPPVEAGGGLGGNQGVAAALRARLKGDVAPPAAAGKASKLNNNNNKFKRLLCNTSQLSVFPGLFSMLGVLVRLIRSVLPIWKSIHFLNS